MFSSNIKCFYLILIVFFVKIVSGLKGQDSGRFGFLMPNVHPHRVSHVFLFLINCWIWPQNPCIYNELLKKP
jgi:hypothetical protein